MSGKNPTDPAAADLQRLRRRVRELEAEAASLRPARQAWEEGREQYRLLFEAAPMGVAVATRTGEVRTANPALEAFLGYSEEEMQTGGVIGRCVAPEDLDRALEALERHGRVRDLELEVRRKDGAVRCGVANVDPIRLGGEGLLFAVVADVTDRRRAEDALRRSEEKYRALAESTNDVPYTMEAGGVLTYVGPQAARFGFDPQEIVGRSFLDYVVDEDRPGVAENFRRAVGTGEEALEEFRVRSPEGQVYWFEDRGRVRRDDAGRVVGLTGILRDVTDRKRAEAAQRASDERYRELVENISDVVYVLDAEGVVTYVSPAVTAAMGYEPSEVIGRRLLEFVPPEEQAEVSRNFADALAGRPSVDEALVLNKAGEARWVRASNRPVVSEGRIVGLTGVLRDVTERKRAEEALRNSELMYRTTIDAVDEAINAVSPDLRLRLLNRQFADWCRELGAGEPRVGLPLREALPFLPASMEEEYASVFRTGEALITRETSALSGREVVTETHKIPVIENGRVVRVITVVHDVTERVRAEEALREGRRRERRFREQLAALQEVTVQLSVTESFDDLCREAVRRGRQELGLGRVSLWFTMPDDPSGLAGSFGIDEAGALRDERSSRHVIEPGRVMELLANRDQWLVVDEDAPLRDDANRIVGRGWHAVAAMWDGETIIGFLCADGLLADGPLTEEQRQTLPLYASTLGHLCSRMRTVERLREREAGERSFREDLAALHEVTLELSASESFDKLCRRAVELGRSRLGIDRIGLWFLTGRPTEARGSFGTDESGRLRDEREAVGPVAPQSPMGRVLNERTRLEVLDDVELQDQTERVVGRGTAVLASLWDGARIIGCLCADNLLSGRAVSAYQRELVALYASTLGHLCSRIRAVERLRESEAGERSFREGLAALHAVTLELSAAPSFEDLCRRAVELGQQRLGFERLGLWFRTSGPKEVRGSFGIDERGNLRDEGEVVTRIQPGSFVDRVLSDDVRLAVKPETPLRDNRGRAVGDGAAAMASLWDGQSIIGYISADNLLEHGPLTPNRCELLALYASALGHLCSRIRAVEELRQSEVRFRDLFENAPLCVFEMDISRWPAMLLSGNRLAGRTYGYPPEAFASMLASELVPEEAHPRLREMIRRTRPGQTVTVEGRSRRRDGSMFPVRVMMSVSGHFEPRRAIVTVEDITEEKRAEQALRDSEARYRALVEQVPAVTYTAALDGASTTLYISPQVLTLLGCAPEEYQADSEAWRKALHPEDAERVMAELHRAHASGGRFLSEYRMRRRDGEVVWVRDDASIIHDESGRPLFLQGLMFDITDRKRAEEELRIKDSAIESSINAIALGDLEGRLTYVNPSFVRLWGYEDAGEVVGRPAVSFWRSAERAAEVLRAVQTGGSWTGELTARRRDGSDFEVSMSASTVTDEQGRPACLMASFVDVTDRVRAQEALARSRDRLRYVIDNMWDIIFEIDLEGDYTFGNPAAERVTGYSVDDLLKMNMAELVVPEHHERVFARLRERRRGKPLPQPFIFDIRHARGRRVTLELTTTGVRRDGRLVGVQGIARDITERVRAEEALRAARAKLTGAREEERRRLAGELHDSVGQGLIALQLGLRGVLARTREGVTAPELVGPTDRLCEQADSLIEETRRVGRGLYPTTLESLGLGAALQQLAQDFPSEVQVTLECASPEPGVDLRKARLDGEVEIALFRIAQEAVANAVRHGKADRVRVRLTYADGRAVLTVTDNGSGFREGPAGAGGLGLTMMQERAQACGGRVKVDSRKGRTQVRAEVPAETLPPEPSEP